jgi:copper homeostasis protein
MTTTTRESSIWSPPQHMNPIIETGVYDIDSALAASQGGADRVELCANLPQGGVSPSGGVIQTVREAIQIGLWVMVRPRAHDFCYSDLEFKAMLADIALARRLGADGVVLGVLTPDGQVDVARTRELVQAATPMEVTFHRAFDMTRDLPEALDVLMDTGVNRVLTTGGKDNPLDALDLLRELIAQAGSNITMMIARTDETTISQVMRGCGAREIHINARTRQPGRMRYRKHQPLMSMTSGQEYDWPWTDARRVAAAVRLAREIAPGVSLDSIAGACQPEAQARPAD